MSDRFGEDLDSLLDPRTVLRRRQQSQTRPADDPTVYLEDEPTTAPPTDYTDTDPYVPPAEEEAPPAEEEADEFNFTDFEEDVEEQIDDITGITDEISDRANREYRRRFITDPNTGVQYPIIEYSDDGGQTWIQDESFDYQRPYESLEDLYAAAGSVLSFQDWLAANPELGAFIDPSQAIGELGSVITDTGDLTDERAEALEFAAQNLGFDSGQELQAAIQGMASELGLGISGQEGFTAEEQTQQRRFVNNLVAQMSAQTERDVDAVLGETGSTMRAFQMADDSRRQIVNAQLQYQMGIAQEDWMRKEAEYQQLKDRWATMVSQGLMSQTQYMETTLNARALQIQGYAQQVDAIVQNNQQLTEVYSADLQAVRTHAQITYDAINMEMGLNEESLAATTEAFEAYLAPLYAQLDAEITALDAIMAGGEAGLISSQAAVAEAEAGAYESQASAGGDVPDMVSTVGLGIMGVGGAIGGAAIAAGVAFPPLGIGLLVVGGLMTLFGLF